MPNNVITNRRGVEIVMQDEYDIHGKKTDRRIPAARTWPGLYDYVYCMADNAWVCNTCAADHMDEIDGVDVIYEDGIYCEYCNKHLSA